MIMQVLDDFTHAIRWEIVRVVREDQAVVHVVCSPVKFGLNATKRIPMSVHMVSNGIPASE